MKPFQKAPTPLAWVSKVTAATEPRSAFTKFLHVKQGVMYGTDMARLHWAVTDLEPGVYEPKTMSKIFETFGNFDTKLNALLSSIDYGVMKSALIQDLEPVIIDQDSAATEPDKKLSCFRIPGCKFPFQISFILDALNDELQQPIFYDGSQIITGFNSFGGFMITGVNQ